MTKEAGVRCISLKDMHLPMKSAPEQRKEAHQKIEAAGLVLMGGGVIYLKNDENNIRGRVRVCQGRGNADHHLQP